MYIYIYIYTYIYIYIYTHTHKAAAEVTIADPTQPDCPLVACSAGSRLCYYITTNRL